MYVVLSNRYLVIHPAGVEIDADRVARDERFS
jgi:hypothetical protein